MKKLISCITEFTFSVRFTIYPNTRNRREYQTIDKYSNFFVTKNTNEKTHHLYHRVHFVRPLSTINLQKTNGEKVLFIANVFAQ